MDNYNRNNQITKFNQNSSAVQGFNNSNTAGLLSTEGINAISKLDKNAQSLLLSGIIEYEKKALENRSRIEEKVVDSQKQIQMQQIQNDREIKLTQQNNERNRDLSKGHMDAYNRERKGISNGWGLGSKTHDDPSRHTCKCRSFFK